MEKLVRELEERMVKVSKDFGFQEMDKLWDDVMSAYNKYRELDLDDEDLEDRFETLYDQADELNEIMIMMRDFRRYF